MKKNPFLPKGAIRESVVASTMRSPGKGSKEFLFGAGNEINANNKAELTQAIAHMISVASANGGVLSEAQAEQRESLASVHAGMVTAAFASPAELAAVGEEMSNDLYATANRDGFMRRLLVRQDLAARGQIPTARLRTKKIVAVSASGPSKVQSQLVRDNYFYPNEFNIIARPFIEARELARTSDDILQEKYIESLSSLMVQEDRTWKVMADSVANLADGNSVSNFATSMSPTTLSAFKNKVTQWGLTAAYWVQANDLWNDIIGDSGFQQLIDPVSKQELLLSGQLGTILGMTILSDAFRHPEHKVLSAGEQYIVSSPESHGQYTDRGGLDVQNLDGSTENTPGRGWNISELISMVVANPRSVARGRRV